MHTSPRIICCAVLLLLSVATVCVAQKAASPDRVAAKIDQFLENHWQSKWIEPALSCTDTEFVRRVTLDLMGRIPTLAELDRFQADKSKTKRARLVGRLLTSPEFPLHFGSVLDQIIQSRYAGNTAFVDYLRRSMRDGKRWDKLFRELMLGPWKTRQSKPANRFLDKRAKMTDVLAVDTARVFFGVDISCAKCHDHPLVDDWKKQHFYGMVAFFNRTTGGRGRVGEKNAGEVMFLGNDGKEKVAKVMFLSGQVIDDPTSKLSKNSKDKKRKTSRPGRKIRFSRREQLVRVALAEKKFFSRAIVNRVWSYFFGRGIVEPVDQMHSGNAPSVPGLLEWLADDFVTHGYDLHRLIRSITLSRAYQLSSRWDQTQSIPSAQDFAVARLRPLSRRQLALSILLATGTVQFTEPDGIQQRIESYAGSRGLSRVEQYMRAEVRARSLVNSLDPRRVEFRTSVTEALFMSNNSAVQDLVKASGTNLATQLGKIGDDGLLVRSASRKILGRALAGPDSERLIGWLKRQKDDRQQAVEQLIWVLLSSAEFRFNH